MAERISRLGQPGVTARTFHAHALSQLRWFWPSRHDGAELPRILESKAAIIGRLARALPGGYRFTPTKDLADEIEWAKSRRLGPATYAAEAEAAGRAPPIPPELFGRLFADYERAKQRAGLDRLRRHAHADRRPARDRRRQPSDRPVAQTLAERGRVPGHQPAPGATARAVARGWPRPVRGGRRGPDDLLVHRRDASVPHGLRRAVRGREDHPPYRELPVHAGDPRARQSADRGDRAFKGTACHATSGRRAGRQAVPRRRQRDGRRRGRRARGSRPTGSPATEIARAGPDQCPAGAAGAGVHARRRRLPGSRPALLRATGRARRHSGDPRCRLDHRRARLRARASWTCGAASWATGKGSCRPVARRASGRPRSTRSSPSSTRSSRATRTLARRRC